MPKKPKQKRIQCWSSPEEWESFDRWCKERNSSKNIVLMTLIRERMNTTTSPDSKHGSKPPNQKNLDRAMRVVEKALIHEVAMAGDLVLSTKLRPILDRLKTRFGT